MIAWLCRANSLGGRPQQSEKLARGRGQQQICRDSQMQASKSKPTPHADSMYIPHFRQGALPVLSHKSSRILTRTTPLDNPKHPLTFPDIPRSPLRPTYPHLFIFHHQHTFFVFLLSPAISLSCSFPPTSSCPACLPSSPGPYTPPVPRFILYHPIPTPPHNLQTSSLSKQHHQSYLPYVSLQPFS